jgi:ribosomal protein S2
MKLKKIGKPKNKLLQLQILKLHNKKKSYDFSIDLKQMEVNLHKISDVIYKYHNADKRILFAGFPSSFSQTLKSTKHILIPEFLWFDGMLSNRTSFVNSSMKKTPKNIFRLMLKLKKKLDLIVVYNLNKNSTAIKEGYLERVPVITFSKQTDVFNIKTTYNSTGNYEFINERSENNSLFFSFIKATLNRAKKTKKIRNYRNLNELREIYKKRNRWNNTRKTSWKNKKAQSFKKRKHSS